MSQTVYPSHPPMWSIGNGVVLTEEAVRQFENLFRVQWDNVQNVPPWLSASRFNVMAYGATGDGVTDDRDAIQDAINAAIAAGEGNLVYFPRPEVFYNVLSGFDKIENGQIVYFSGDALDTTKIHFNPLVPGVLFDFDPNGAAGLLQYRSGIVNLSIYSDNTVQKTALRGIETEQFYMRHCHIMFNQVGDFSSIGLHLFGRHMAHFEGCRVQAGRPIVVGKNTYAAQPTGLDHFHFNNMVIHGIDNTPNPLIEIGAGCHLSSVHFGPGCVLVGGNGMLVYNSTADADGGMQVFSIKGFRWENAGTTQTRPGLDIQLHASKFGQAVLNISDFEMGVFAGVGAGIGMRFRNIGQITLRDGKFAGASGLVSYDIDGTCDNILIDNVHAPAGILPSISGLDKIWGSGFKTVFPAEAERIKFYRRSSEFLADRSFSILDHQVWTKKTTLAAGATLEIPPGDSQLGFAHITVVASKGTGTQGGATFVLGPDFTDLTSYMIAGHADFDDAVTAGKICVYADLVADRIKITNNLAESRDISVVVFFNRVTAHV